MHYQLRRTMMKLLICFLLLFTDTGEPDWKRSCAIDVEFADRNYKSSPDGVYEFSLGNMDQYNITSLHKIKIEYSGSNIPFKYGDVLTNL